jgi:putative ABC transport system permease protein
MEIGPIFRALIYQKSRFWLITLEIALTLAIVANCFNMIGDERAKMERPTGMDEENLLVVESEPIAPEFEDDEYVRASYEEDLRVLRALPGVQAATGTHAIPLSGSGSNHSRRAAGTETEPIGTPHFRMGTEALETLGVELIAGRDFVETDFPEPKTGEEEGEEAETAPAEVRPVIVTKEVADLLFPAGDAAGKIIESSDGSSLNVIVGVLARMQGSWPHSAWAERVVIHPGMPANERRARYLVRAEPGMVDDLYTVLDASLLRVNEGRIVSVRTLKEIKAKTYRPNMVVTGMLEVLSVLLVLVTSLGLIGLTSFSVTQRTREIGTRRALGATRGAILRYFLVENWIVTSAGLTLGLVLTYGLNLALAQSAEVSRIGFTQVATGMLVLWLAGLMAALVPALRGTTVPPVLATRTV